MYRSICVFDKPVLYFILWYHSGGTACESEPSNMECSKDLPHWHKESGWSAPPQSGRGGSRFEQEAVNREGRRWALKTGSDQCYLVVQCSPQIHTLFKEGFRRAQTIVRSIRMASGRDWNKIPTSSGPARGDGWSTGCSVPRWTSHTDDSQHLSLCRSVG